LHGDGFLIDGAGLLSQPFGFPLLAAGFYRVGPSGVGSPHPFDRLGHLTRGVQMHALTVLVCIVGLHKLALGHRRQFGDALAMAFRLGSALLDFGTRLVGLAYRVRNGGIDAMPPKPYTPAATTLPLFDIGPVLLRFPAQGLGALRCGLMGLPVGLRGQLLGESLGGGPLRGCMPLRFLDYGGLMGLASVCHLLQGFAHMRRQRFWRGLVTLACNILRSLLVTHRRRRGHDHTRPIRHGAPLCNRVRDGPLMLRRRAFHALRFQGSVIHTGFQTFGGKMMVHHFCPGFAPVIQRFAIIPRPNLVAETTG